MSYKREWNLQLSGSRRGRVFACYATVVVKKHIFPECIFLYLHKYGHCKVIIYDFLFRGYNIKKTM